MYPITGALSLLGAGVATYPREQPLGSVFTLAPLLHKYYSGQPLQYSVLLRR